MYLSDTLRTIKDKQLVTVVDDIKHEHEFYFSYRLLGLFMDNKRFLTMIDNSTCEIIVDKTMEA